MPHASLMRKGMSFPEQSECVSEKNNEDAERIDILRRKNGLRWLGNEL